MYALTTYNHSNDINPDNLIYIYMKFEDNFIMSLNVYKQWSFVSIYYYTSL